jgi:hypothetical protein
MATTFTFDPDEFQAVVAEWEELLAALEKQRSGFADLDGLANQAPADDPATRTFLQQARTALASADHSSEALRQYVSQFLTQLRLAKVTYVDTDTSGANRLSVVVE